MNRPVNTSTDVPTGTKRKVDACYVCGSEQFEILTIVNSDPRYDPEPNVWELISHSCLLVLAKRIKALEEKVG